MALKIRLARGGAKKRPYYRIVIADSRMPRDGRYIEKVGTYNPMLSKDDPKRIQLEEERIRHWISVGAKPTDRVARFLGRAEILPMPAIPANQTKQHLPKAKAQERLKEAAAAAKAEAEAPPAEETPAEEAPAEEAKTEEPAAEEAPAEEAKAEEPAAEEAPAEEAKAEEPAAEEAKAEEPAAEEAKAEEAPAEDAPAEEPKAE